MLLMYISCGEGVGCTLDGHYAAPAAALCMEALSWSSPESFAFARLLLLWIAMALSCWVMSWIVILRIVSTRFLAAFVPSCIREQRLQSRLPIPLDRGIKNACTLVGLGRPPRGHLCSYFMRASGTRPSVGSSVVRLTPLGGGGGLVTVRWHEVAVGVGRNASPDRNLFGPSARFTKHLPAL